MMAMPQNTAASSTAPVAQLACIPPGSQATATPTKPTATETQRQAGTISPSNGRASTVAMIGAEKYRVSICAKGITRDAE